MGSRLGTMNLWSEMLSGTDGALISDLLYEQYDLIVSEWPTAANEVVLVLDQNDEITDVAFYALSLMSDDEVSDILGAVTKGEEIQAASRTVSFADVLNTSFKMVLNSEYYTKGSDGVWRDIRDDEASMELVIENGYDIQIVGILRPNPEATAAAISGTFGYTSALTSYVIEKTSDSEIVKEQRLPENENYDVLTGLPFVITRRSIPLTLIRRKRSLLILLP